MQPQSKTITALNLHLFDSQLTSLMSLRGITWIWATGWHPKFPDPSWQSTHRPALQTGGRQRTSLPGTVGYCPLLPNSKATAWAAHWNFARHLFVFGKIYSRRWSYLTLVCLFAWLLVLTKIEIYCSSMFNIRVSLLPRNFPSNRALSCLSPSQAALLQLITR